MAKERRTYTDEFKNQMVELYNSGKSKAEIAKEYDVSPSTLDRWIQAHSETENNEQHIKGSEVTSEKQYDNTEEDEISLIDLFAVLLHYKWLIIITTLVAMIGVIIFAVVSIKLPAEDSPMPNLYTPSAKMLIQESSSSGG